MSRELLDIASSMRSIERKNKEDRTLCRLTRTPRHVGKKPEQDPPKYDGYISLSYTYLNYAYL